MRSAQPTRRKDEWVARFFQLSGAAPEDSEESEQDTHTTNLSARAEKESPLRQVASAPSGYDEPHFRTSSSSKPFDENYITELPSRGSSSTVVAKDDSDEQSESSSEQPEVIYSGLPGTLKGEPAKPSVKESLKPAKSHEDPLRADPKIAALLDERAEVEKTMGALIADDTALAKVRTDVDKLSLQISALDPKVPEQEKERARLHAECERMVDEATTGNAELTGLGEQYDKLSAQLEKELERLNKQGIAPQQLGAEYADEEKKVGWRADHWKGPFEKNERLKALFRESTHFRTEYYSSAKRDETELNIGPDGKVRTADGDIRRNAKGEHQSEMVINPETGKMHEFRPAKALIGETGTDRMVGKDKQVTEFVHHSSVLSGKNVTGAGSFKTDAEGNLTQITNKSGHYKPGITKLVQSVETLLQQGAFSDRSWEGGDHLAGKEKALFSLTKKTMEAASKLQVEVRQETLAMDRALEQDAAANVDAQAKGIVEKSALLKKQLDAIAKAQQVLAKLGVSQRNKITGEVEYLDVRPGMTGPEVRLAPTKTKDVDEFLKSGGGNEDAAQKKEAMLTELEQKTAKRRNELDAQAAAQSGSDKLPHSVDDLLDEFKSMGFVEPVEKKTQKASVASSASSADDHYSMPSLGGAPVNSADDHYSQPEIRGAASKASTASSSDASSLRESGSNYDHYSQPELQGAPSTPATTDSLSDISPRDSLSESDHYSQPEIRGASSKPATTDSLSEIDPLRQSDGKHNYDPHKSKDEDGEESEDEGVDSKKSVAAAYKSTNFEDIGKDDK